MTNLKAGAVYSPGHAVSFASKMRGYFHSLAIGSD